MPTAVGGGGGIDGFVGSMYCIYKYIYIKWVFIINVERPFRSVVYYYYYYLAGERKVILFLLEYIHIYVSIYFCFIAN